MVAAIVLYVVIGLLYNLGCIDEMKANGLYQEMPRKDKIRIFLICAVNWPYHLGRDTMRTSITKHLKKD